MKVTPQRLEQLHDPRAVDVVLLQELAGLARRLHAMTVTSRDPEALREATSVLISLGLAGAGSEVFAKMMRDGADA